MGFIMSNKINKIYVVHHSHTDIGYTDLQEKIIYNQIDYIKSAVSILKKAVKDGSPYKNFRWNCETYYCVEQFLAEATEQERNDFYDLVKTGHIGISATYLNFNDLADKVILQKRTAEMKNTLAQNGVALKTAMIADINGISMGARDAYINNGIEFLFMNIHIHHGMYPLYQNQIPFWWENDEGKKLLVWSGEHYNLGNAMGLVYLKGTEDPIGNLKENIDQCIDDYDKLGYPYDFLITSVSGVFSDNAPPEPMIIDTINAYQQKYGNDVEIKMVSLQELYALVGDKIQDAPVYKGDINDWWANGIGSTPDAVKHYKEAQRLYHLCGRLDKNAYEDYAQETRIAEDNFLLYAEHTWGHSSTISNPYDTMVINLDLRNTSYASKAHEASAKMLNRISHKLGDKLRYYDTDGRIKAINTSDKQMKMPVEFYVETRSLPAAEITDEKSGKKLPVQLSAHPRGVLVSFTDEFAPNEEKFYSYKSFDKPATRLNVTEIINGKPSLHWRLGYIDNDFDTIHGELPYGIENNWMKISYEIGKGITSFYNKQTGEEMLKDGFSKFFTPIYEHTEIKTEPNEERRKVGRNIRGAHSIQKQGKLIEIKCLEAGDVFNTVELVFELEGTYHNSVVLKVYNDLPRIDFKYKVAKTLSEEIESLFLPLTLDVSNSELYIDKGGVTFRPAIDQLPGTCMEYYMVDNGLAYISDKGSVIINSLDVPLIYTGEMKYHPIKLCSNQSEDNQRDVYSWIMNNVWETNFKMDLSGFYEFCYSLEISDITCSKDCFKKIEDNSFGAVAFITE